MRTSVLLLAVATCAAVSSVTEGRIANPPAGSKPAPPTSLAHGRELVRSICSSCHTLDRLSAQHLDKDEWRHLINGMLSEGAAVTAEETDVMCEYLAKNFGRSSE